MSFTSRASSIVRFEPIEAYAAAHRRTMRIVGSTVSLSLRMADSKVADTGLRALKEGFVVGPRDLEALVPGLTAAAWEFAAGAEFNVLRTLTDGVLVTLECPRVQDLSPFSAEGVLRGFAARIIVEMTGF